MCSCRSPLRRACPPPHIEKAFDLRWYKVTRRPRRGRAYRCTIPLHPDPLPPCEGGRGGREWGDGKRDSLSAPAPQSGCAEGCYRLKRKSVSGNGITSAASPSLLGERERVQRMKRTCSTDVLRPQEKAISAYRTPSPACGGSLKCNGALDFLFGSAHFSPRHRLQQ